MTHHHGTNFGQGNFNFGNPGFDFSAGHSHFNLGNFHMPQTHFDTGLNLPNFNLPPLTMPDLGSSLGLNTHPTPLLFSTPLSGAPAQTHVSTGHSTLEHSTPSGLEAYLELSGPMSSQLGNHGLGMGLEGLSALVTAAEAGHRLAHHATHDIQLGVPTAQALTCNTLGAFSQGGSQLLMGTAISGAVLGGGVAALSTSATGFATGNPLLAAGGAAGAVGIAHLTLPAFNAASDIAQTVGDGVTALCNEAFNQARLAARGGM